MENMNELRWTMDVMLIKAKENPMPINHDYETRFRVWTEQILKNRFNAIISTGGNAEYIKRMSELVLDDYDRLIERARKEFTIDKNTDQYHKRYHELFTITKETIRLYEGQNND